MLKFCSNSNGGIQGLSFIHGFRHFLFYSTSTAAEGNPSFVNYLVESLGFSSKQALSTSTKLAHRRQGQGAKKVSDFNFSENANSVTNYLRQIGLEQSHIGKIIASTPNLLLCNVDKTLKPKTDIFLKLGFSEPDFAEIIKARPLIFFMGIETSIVPTVQSLRETLGSDSLIISILKRSRCINIKSISKFLEPNVALLRNYGIPLDSIRKQLLMSTYWLVRKPEFFQDAVIKVEEEWGIPRNASAFLTGVRVFSGYREKSIDSKQQVFKSFGWTESDVRTLVRSCPSCLCLSEAKVKKKLGFLMKELGYEPHYLASKPSLLTYSLEKRILPRYEALEILKEKGLIKLDYSLYGAVCLRDSEFLKRFVLPFKEVDKVYSKLAQITNLNLNVA